MILVDTNVLVALIDERDGHRERAARDLRKVSGRAVAVTEAVLSETCFLLSQGWARRRLRFLLEALPVRGYRLEEPWRGDLFSWLESYEEHEPDFADAELAVAASRDRTLRVWTYDREFTTTWRKVNGGRIPLVGA